MILPACLAIAPAEEVLTLSCEYGPCAICGGPACAVHDQCFGCLRVFCSRCDTEGGMPVTAFPGDRQAHPHTARRA